MPISQHLYRRGDRYWYRRSIAIPGRRRYDVRVSLQTGYNSIARRLVTLLDAEALRLSSSEPSMFAILKRRAPSLPEASDDDLRLALQAHFKDVLRRHLGRHAGQEHSGDFVRRQAENLADFDLFNLLIETGTTRGTVNSLKVEEHLRGLAEAGFDLDRLIQLDRAYRDRYTPRSRHPVPTGERDAYFARLGRARTPEVLERFDEMLLHGHREAVWRAELQRGRVAAAVGDETTTPVFRADQRPFERHLFIPPTDADERAAAATQTGAGQSAPPAAAPPAEALATTEVGLGPVQPRQVSELSRPAAASEMSVTAPTVLPPAPSELASSDTDTPPAVLPHPGSAQPQASDGTDRQVLQHAAPPSDATTIAGAAPQVMTFSAVAQAFLDDRLEHDPGYTGVADNKTATKLMLHVLGADRPFSALKQKDLTDFVTLLGRLPARWGRTAAERHGGIPASLARAATMKKEDIGVRATTIQKHLSALKMIVDYARGHSLKPAEELDFEFFGAQIRRQNRVEKREIGRGRENWTPAEIPKLLGAPPFRGSKGWDPRLRYKPGGMFLHDADYWVPLLAIHTGARSGEICGLMLSDIDDAAPVSTMTFRFTQNRRVKNEASQRTIPVHPELIRLGFLDYVRAMRSTGHTSLFPELTPSPTGNWAATYKKRFDKLLAAAFPNGTDGRIKLRGAVKEKDVHSFRGMVITLMSAKHTSALVQGIIGHDAGDDRLAADDRNKTTRDYLSKFTPEQMLPVLGATTFLTESLRARPLCLSPAVASKAGKGWRMSKAWMERAPSMPEVGH